VLAQAFSIKFIILYVFIIGGCYVHFRGRVRFSFIRQITSYSTILSPLNGFMYLFSAVHNRPFHDLDKFPELALLKDNWETIRDEANKLYEAGHVKASDKLDDIAFNSFFRRGWKRFYLKWYRSYLPSAQELCPNTVELLSQLPNIKGAMFTLLPSGSQLMKHRDPYAGSLRYHLGLVTPNSDDCRIYVDGQMYSWRNGEDVLFDETFIHYAHNESDEDRIILFCDVERPMRFRFASWVNRFFSSTLIAASETKNVEGEHVGALNKAFSGLYQIRKVGRAIKERNKPIYYLLKYAIFAGLLYLLLA